MGTGMLHTPGRTRSTGGRGAVVMAESVPQSPPVTSTDDRYIHGHGDSVLRSHRWRTAENSAAYLLPHLRAGMRLLDVGCGPGTLTVDLARRVGSTGEVVGVELSEAGGAGTAPPPPPHGPATTPLPAG